MSRDETKVTGFFPLARVHGSGENFWITDEATGEIISEIRRTRVEAWRTARERL